MSARLAGGRSTSRGGQEQEAGSQLPAASSALALLAGLLLAACSPPGAGAVGEECTEKEDCLTRLCMQEERFGEPTGWLEGYCIAPCPAGSCPEGAGCLDIGRPTCLSSCEVTADCRSGYLCHPLGRVCLPDCRNGWPCGPSLQCSASGLCLLPGLEPPPTRLDGGVGRDAGGDGGAPPGSDGGTDPPHEAPLGAPCAGPESCASGLCMLEAPLELGGVSWTDGYCTAPCPPGGGPCPPHSGCALLKEGPLCMAACATAGSCRRGYVCHPQWMVCLPDCRQGYPCPPGTTCNNRGVCGGGGGEGRR